jgi:hypothetical protein
VEKVEIQTQTAKIEQTFATIAAPTQ